MTADRFGVDPDYQPLEGIKGKVISRWLIAVAIVLGLNVALLVLTLVLNPRVDGPAGSSIVTTEEGIGAWRETLERLGVPVTQLRVHLADAGSDVPVGAVLVVIEPDGRYIDDAYRRALAAHLDAGGTVITTLSDGLRLGLDIGSATLLDGGPAARVEDVGGDIADVESLRVTERTIEGAEELLVETAIGEGIVAHHRGVIMLSDLTLVSNAALGDEDNGRLAVRISGPGPVVFDEYVHGFGVGQGLAGVPTAVISVVLTLVAVVVWMWAVGSRFGPPMQADRALPPPRAAYLDGIAASMSRAKPTDAGYGILRSRARAQLDRYGERFPGVPADERRRLAAAALELGDEHLAALDRPIGSGADAIMAASIAAKIEQARTESTP